MVKGVKCDAYTPAKLKPVLGVELTIDGGTIVCLAKNRKGWETLAQAVSLYNQFPETPPTIHKIAELSKGNLILHSDSSIADKVFSDTNKALFAKSEDKAKSYLREQKEIKKGIIDLIGSRKELFGEDYVLATAEFDGANLPGRIVLGKALRWASKETGTPLIAGDCPSYCISQDSSDHRAILAIGSKVTLDTASSKVSEELAPFFTSNRNYIPGLQELEGVYDSGILQANGLIAERCEDFDIISPPMMPKYPLPEGKTADEHLRELCRDGWARKIKDVIPKEKHPEYAARIKMELEVFKEANLSTYFLVVQDYCKFALESGGLIGRARGSGGGCFTSYLLNITAIDPVKYGLLFERFYNAGRKGAMPDIDVDFETSRRESVVEYLRKRYGQDHVGTIGTFQKMVGAGCIKDVFRIKGHSAAEANKITDFIPQKDKISDDLQEAMETDGEASVIGWALHNKAKELSPWVKLNKDGTLTGAYAKDFELAMRLEGTKRSFGRHPSGIVVYPNKLSDVMPMAYTGGDATIALEMNSVEMMGGVKFDVLATSVLDRISDFEKLMKTGSIE
jgi:DNA polymerase III subunit alpha